MISLGLLNILSIMLVMAKRPKPKTRSEKPADTEQVNLRVSSKLLDQLDAIGEPTGLKRSHLIQQAIFEFVQRNRMQSIPTAPLASR